jgi:hypothetical protein
MSIQSNSTKSSHDRGAAGFPKKRKDTDEADSPFGYYRMMATMASTVVSTTKNNGKEEIKVLAALVENKNFL